MARDIKEIKKEMTDAYLSDATVREKYGLESEATFEGSFSAVSVESILFYVVAFSIWIMEKLMDQHQEQVDAALAAQTAHTARWYRNLVLGFEWRGENPVKYCSVDDRGCRLKVKIAGGEAGARTTVEADAAAALESYLGEEKDAGMKIEVVNENQNLLKVGMTVWYDPLALAPGDKAVEGELKRYVSALDFDGLLTQNAIEDAVQGVSGVKMVKTERLLTRYAGNGWEPLGNQRRAESGYWQLADGDVSVRYERYRKENL